MHAANYSDGTLAYSRSLVPQVEEGRAWRGRPLRLQEYRPYPLRRRAHTTTTVEVDAPRARERCEGAVREPRVGITVAPNAAAIASTDRVSARPRRHIPIATRS